MYAGSNILFCFKYIIYSSIRIKYLLIACCNNTEEEEEVIVKELEEIVVF